MRKSPRLILGAAAAIAGGLPACSAGRLPELPAPDATEMTVFLIGDAGEPDPRNPEPALVALREQAAARPGRSLILFLGDNIYPDGVPEERSADWPDARRRLLAQVEAVPREATAIFVPGNHDWADGGPFGLYSVRQQAVLLERLAAGRDILLLPSDGCPGPALIERGRLRLVLLDTQWWLHPYIVQDAASGCPGTTGAVTARLREAVSGGSEGQITIVAGHHPLMTGGKHGGYCGLTAPFHRFGGQSQDIVSSANRTMRDSLESAFAADPPLLYAAGHEHNLQVLRGSASVRTTIVSGAGSRAKVSCGVHLRESYYVAPNRTGFMRLDILTGGGVLLSVYRYTKDGRGGRSYSRWLEAPSE